MADEHMIGAEEDDVQFMRTVIHYENIFCKSSSVSSFQEDHLCLSCVPVSGVKRMALSGEVFGNRMCFLEDISNEVENLFLERKKAMDIAKYHLDYLSCSSPSLACHAFVFFFFLFSLACSVILFPALTVLIQADINKKRRINYLIKLDSFSSLSLS